MAESAPVTLETSFTPAPPPAIPRKTPNIYVVGAQSTGKTTLVGELSLYFQTRRPTYHSRPVDQPVILVETARNVLRDNNIASGDILSPPKAKELQKLILIAQHKAESSVAREWFISDRSGVDAMVYTQRYVGRDDMHQFMQEPGWEAMKKLMEESLVVVCQAGVSWLVDDGVRLMPKDEKDWYELHEMFCELLEWLGLKYVVVPNDVSDIQSRVRLVLEAWEALDHDR